MIHVLENINLDRIGHRVTTNSPSQGKTLQLNKVVVSNLTARGASLSAGMTNGCGGDNPNYTVRRCVSLSQDGDCVPTIGKTDAGCISATGSWWCWLCPGR